MRKVVLNMMVVFIISGGWFVVNGQSFKESSAKENKILLSGSLNNDSKISFEQSSKINLVPSDIEAQKKSPWLAAGLSAVLPGAGEFYTESYIKSAAFLAVEAAAIAVSIIWNKKGNDQTNVFQKYADQHWSAERYAKWTIAHASSINSNIDPANYNVIVNGKVNWNELNRLEGDLGSYYSHRLPYYGEQQYYELIGKYPQFAVGWEEFGDNVNKSYAYGDPLPQQFLDYSIMRGDANDFYRISSTATSVIIINHILSAIDAAWTTSKFNKALQAHASIEKFNAGFEVVYYPQLNIRYNF